MGAEVSAAEDALRATGGNIDAAAAKLLEAPPPSQPQPQQPPPPPDLPTDDEDREAALQAARELVERGIGRRLAGADADAEGGATCSSSGACSTRSSAGPLAIATS